MAAMNLVRLLLRFPTSTSEPPAEPFDILLFLNVAGLYDAEKELTAFP
jgi:hypothetical protein